MTSYHYSVHLACVSINQLVAQNDRYVSSRLSFVVDSQQMNNINKGTNVVKRYIVSVSLVSLQKVTRNVQGLRLYLIALYFIFSY